MGTPLRPHGNGNAPSAKTRLAKITRHSVKPFYDWTMAIRQTKTSGIDNLMQEIDTQAAKQHEAVITVEHIEELKQLNDTLQESIIQLKDAKAGMDDAREVCENIYKRLWGIIDTIQAALLRAENTHIKAHIDENELQKLSLFSDEFLKAEEQLLTRHLEKQKELWLTSLSEQRRNLESNEGIWLSKKAFHTLLWFFLLPLCYTIISIGYYLSVLWEKG
ncbi:hypothetical protein [Alistipes sp.]|jgi:hypothetical protein|uniref:hypothetical protein n=1 Tax=unclassified Alistipes TaxID=2608932 RepID=UPI00307E5AAE